MTKLIPYLICRNAPEAIDFYARAFGGRVLSKTPGPDGRILNSMLDIDGAMLMVMEEMPDMGGQSPLSLNGTPLMLALEVPDCDAFYARAVEAGCTAGMPLQDMFWGQRWGSVKCPYGFHWSIATSQREVSEEEIRVAVANMSHEGHCPDGSTSWKARETAEVLA